MLLFSKSSKKLISSGCSWTYQRKNKTNWPEHLAAKLEMEHINVGKAGSGNEGIYQRMVDVLSSTKNIGLAVCLWSNSNRWDFYNKSFSPRVFPEELKKYADSKYNLEKSLRWFNAFQNFCECNDIPFIQAQGIYPINSSFWEDDKDRISQIKCMIDYPIYNYIKRNTFLGWPIFKEIGGFTMSDKLNKSLRVSEIDTHPNEKGHKYLAEIFYKHYKLVYGDL